MPFVKVPVPPEYNERGYKLAVDGQLGVATTGALKLFLQANALDLLRERMGRSAVPFPLDDAIRSVLSGFRVARQDM